MRLKRTILTALATMAASPALAHGGSHAAGFVTGMVHPFGGLDHILAMVATGLFAAMIGGRALWAVPASFLGMMLAGGVLGFSGIVIPVAEIGIAVSVIALGFIVSFGRSWSTETAMVLVGLFAVFHGYAHGAELPVEANAISYSFGFVSASAFLHLLGIAAGSGLLRNAKAVRIVGAAVSIGGVVLALG